MTAIRGSFGFLSGGPSRAFIHQHDRDEREAQSLEYLAREIR